jgi:hypothetical protein
LPYRVSYASLPLKAHDRIRTGDLILTKEVLYQLSYVGNKTDVSSQYFGGQLAAN